MLYAEGRRCLDCDLYCQDHELKACRNCGWRFCQFCVEDHTNGCDETGDYEPEANSDSNQ